MINQRKALRRAQRLAKRESDMTGDGSYLYENNTKGDWYLPRPTKEGLRICKVNSQFIGDSYYMQYIKSGEIRFVRDMNSPVTQEKLFVYKNFNRDEIKLPETNRDGQWFIPPTGEFTDDSRFFPLLKQGKLKLIREIESQMIREKLITEQPPTITQEGQVEYVKIEEPLTEEERKKKEKILAENPLQGVKLLFD